MLMCSLTLYEFIVSSMTKSNQIFQFYVNALPLGNILLSSQNHGSGIMPLFNWSLYSLRKKKLGDLKSNSNHCEYGEYPQRFALSRDFIEYWLRLAGLSWLLGRSNKLVAEFSRNSDPQQKEVAKYTPRVSIYSLVIESSCWSCKY